MLPGGSPSALDLQGGLQRSRTPFDFFHAFHVKKGLRPFTSSIWNTKTVLRQSAWKKPCDGFILFFWVVVCALNWRSFFFHRSKLLLLVLHHICIDKVGSPDGKRYWFHFYSDDFIKNWTFTKIIRLFKNCWVFFSSREKKAANREKLSQSKQKEAKNSTPILLYVKLWNYSDFNF